jgi:GNAT superfamily N-acetyltransferase
MVPIEAPPFSGLRINYNIFKGLDDARVMHYVEVTQYFYLQDIIVLPAFQSKGLGKRLMKAILAYLEEHARPGAFVGLMAAKDVSSFYTQFGFAVRPSERPGMFRLQEET